MEKSIKTAIVETRCDIRDLATIAKFYSLTDIRVGNKSALVRQALSDFAHLISGTDAITSSAAAKTLLDSLGFGSTTKLDRTTKAHLTQVAKESNQLPVSNEMAMAIAMAKEIMKEEKND